MRGFMLRVAIAEAWPHPTLVQDPPLSKSIKEHQRLKYYWVHQHFHPLILKLDAWFPLYGKNSVGTAPWGSRGQPSETTCVQTQSSNAWECCTFSFRRLLLNLCNSLMHWLIVHGHASWIHNRCLWMPHGDHPHWIFTLCTIINDETRVNIPMEEHTLPLVDSVHKVTSYRWNRL